MWRRFGEPAFALSAPPELMALCVRWLGSSGWHMTAPPAGAIAVSARIAGAEVVIDCDALGEPIRGAATDALAELELRFVMAALDRSPAPLAVHAATVARDDAAVIVVGEHAAGKTTTALGLAAAGWRVLGDDIAFVDREGRVVALPRALRVRETSLPHLAAELASAVVREGVHDVAERLYRVPPEVAGGDAVARPVAPRAVVFVQYRPDAPVDFSRMASAAALPALLEHSWGQRVEPRGARAALALLGGAQAWSLEYGGPPSLAAGALERALDIDIGRPLVRD